MTREDQKHSQELQELFGRWCLGAGSKFRDILASEGCSYEGLKTNAEKFRQARRADYDQVIGQTNTFLPAMKSPIPDKYKITEEDCERAADFLTSVYAHGAKSVADAGFTILAHAVFESMVHDGLRMDFIANRS